MMFLEEAQRESTGLKFVLNELSADSPFGENLIRKAGVFGADEKKELTDEFYNISQAIKYAESNEDDLNGIRRTLMRFKNIANIFKKMERSYLHELEFFELKQFLMNLAKLAESFSRMNAEAKFWGIGFKDMEEALDILDPEKKRLAPFYLSERYTKELLDARNEKTRIEGLLRMETNKSVLEDLKIKRTVAVAKEEEAETEVKKALTAKLRPYVSGFEENMKAIGKLDFTVQKALLAKRYDAVCPEIGGDSIELIDMVNPAIETLLRQQSKSFTPVSIKLRAGTTLMTGANMGGKSVAVKTAALNVCLAHMGFFVFAKSANIPLFDGVHLISEDLQSINKGLSTFGAEIVYFNGIVKKAKSEYLFIALDEFARGTNPEEGAIIVRAVARYLNTLNSITLMTTHYDNVAEEGFNQYQVTGLKGLDFNKLAERIADGAEDGVDLIAEHMDYRLLKVGGKMEPPRDALNICRLLALDDGILSSIEEKYSK